MSESKKYDLEDRTKKFSVDLISLCKKLKRDLVSIPLIKQLIRSAISIGANYNEANGASSKKDFKNKIFLCKKEAKETLYWLELLAVTSPNDKEPLRQLWRECHELLLIFAKIAKKSE